MRVLKAKEIEEIDKKVEKDMIELTILKLLKRLRSTKKSLRLGETRKWSERTSKPAILY
jgi:hypothetical protein